MISNNYTSNTAVLFLIFNRPDTTSRVFEQIRKVQPARLYIAADGPRVHKADEDTICAQTRSLVVDNIDWFCEVKTLFRDHNLGCGSAVSSAITWFFEYEEAGIILEDDCLPDLSFFTFCAVLLEKYSDDHRVWHISGNNFQRGIRRGEADYYFSIFTHIWGWATWRDRWSKYKVDAASYDVEKSLQKYDHTVRLKKYFQLRQQQVIQGKTNTWDYQWLYCMWDNNGLAILPQLNLVTNIGFGQGATNTRYKSKNIEVPTHSMKVGKHPETIVQNIDADNFGFVHTFWANLGILKKWLLIKAIYYSLYTK